MVNPLQADNVAHDDAWDKAAETADRLMAEAEKRQAAVAADKEAGLTNLAGWRYAERVADRILGERSEKEQTDLLGSVPGAIGTYYKNVIGGPLEAAYNLGTGTGHFLTGVAAHVGQLGVDTMRAASGTYDEEESAQELTKVDKEIAQTFERIQALPKIAMGLAEPDPKPPKRNKDGILDWSQYDDQDQFISHMGRELTNILAKPFALVDRGAAATEHFTKDLGIPPILAKVLVRDGLNIIVPSLVGKGTKVAFKKAALRTKRGRLKELSEQLDEALKDGDAKTIADLTQELTDTISDITGIKTPDSEIIQTWAEVHKKVRELKEAQSATEAAEAATETTEAADTAATAELLDPEVVAEGNRRLRETAEPTARPAELSAPSAEMANYLAERYDLTGPQKLLPERTSPASEQTSPARGPRREITDKEAQQGEQFAEAYASDQPTLPEKSPETPPVIRLRTDREVPAPRDMDYYWEDAATPERHIHADPTIDPVAAATAVDAAAIESGHIRPPKHIDPATKAAAERNKAAAAAAVEGGEGKVAANATADTVARRIARREAELNKPLTGDTAIDYLQKRYGWGAKRARRIAEQKIEELMQGSGGMRKVRDLQRHLDRIEQKGNAPRTVYNPDNPPLMQRTAPEKPVNLPDVRTSAKYPNVQYEQAPQMAVAAEVVGNILTELGIKDPVRVVSIESMHGNRGVAPHLKVRGKYHTMSDGSHMIGIATRGHDFKTPRGRRAFLEDYLTELGHVVGEDMKLHKKPAVIRAFERAKRDFENVLRMPSETKAAARRRKAAYRDDVLIKEWVADQVAKYALYRETPFGSIKKFLKKAVEKYKELLHRALYGGKKGASERIVPDAAVAELLERKVERARQERALARRAAAKKGGAATAAKKAAIKETGHVTAKEPAAAPTKKTRAKVVEEGVQEAAKGKKKKTKGTSKGKTEETKSPKPTKKRRFSESARIPKGFFDDLMEPAAQPVAPKETSAPATKRVADSAGNELRFPDSPAGRRKVHAQIEQMNKDAGALKYRARQTDSGEFVVEELLIDPSVTNEMFMAELIDPDTGGAYFGGVSFWNELTNMAKKEGVSLSKLLETEFAIEPRRAAKFAKFVKARLKEAQELVPPDAVWETMPWRDGEIVGYPRGSKMVGKSRGGEIPYTSEEVRNISRILAEASGQKWQLFKKALTPWQQAHRTLRDLGGQALVDFVFHPLHEQRARFQREQVFVQKQLREWGETVGLTSEGWVNVGRYFYAERPGGLERLKIMGLEGLTWEQLTNVEKSGALMLRSFYTEMLPRLNKARKQMGEKPFEVDPNDGLYSHFYSEIVKDNRTGGEFKDLPMQEQVKNPLRRAVDRMFGKADRITEKPDPGKAVGKRKHAQAEKRYREKIGKDPQIRYRVNALESALHYADEVLYTIYMGPLYTHFKHLFSETFETINFAHFGDKFKHTYEAHPLAPRKWGAKNPERAEFIKMLKNTEGYKNADKSVLRKEMQEYFGTSKLNLLDKPQLEALYAKLTEGTLPEKLPIKRRTVVRKKKASIMREFPEAYRFLSKYVETVYNNKIKQAFDDPFWKTVENGAYELSKDVSAAYVCGSAGTMLVQTTALATTFAIAGPHTVIGIGKTFSPRAFKKAFKESSALVNRYNTPEAGLNFVRNLEGLTTLEKSRAIAATPLQGLDAWAAVASYWAFKNKAKSMGLKGRKAIRYANERVIETQASASVLDAPSIQRTKVGRTFTALQTYTLAHAMLLMRDVMGLGGGVSAKSIALRSMGYLAGTAAVNYVWKNVLDAYPPYPDPIGALSMSLKEDDMIPVTALKMATEALSTLPMLSSLKYGTDSVAGPLVKNAFDTLNAWSRAQEEWVSSDTMMEFLSEFFASKEGRALVRNAGLPAVDQLAKATRAWNEGSEDFRTYLTGYSFKDVTD